MQYRYASGLAGTPAGKWAWPRQVCHAGRSGPPLAAAAGLSGRAAEPLPPALAELHDDSERRREALEAGRVIDAIKGDARAAQAAFCDERLEAINSEMATIKTEALGLKGIS